MPPLRTISPAKTQKPGNRFFATLITLGVLILIGIWFKEKPAQPVKKIPSQTPLVHPKTESNPGPTSVRVMTKSNLPPTKSSNVVAVLTATTQATATAVLTTNPVRSNLPAFSGFTPRPVQTVFEAQLALARLGISSGSIDGVIGSQTRAALRAFQVREGLPITGELDSATKAKMFLTSAPYAEFLVTTNELAKLHPLGTNWWSKAQQDFLGYESILEMAAEKACCSPNFLRQLNPSINWTNVTAGTALRVPLIERLKPKTMAAFVRVSLSAKTLRAFDIETNLIAHFPCSIAAKVEKRPLGVLYVEKIATDPDYTFNPENFPESPEARRLKTKLILSPGPNNPVGTVWIGLNKPGYGIHGTPVPEQVGRTESHGCFRLANWNAEHLVRMVSVGTPILVEP